MLFMKNTSSQSKMSGVKDIGQLLTALLAGILAVICVYYLATNYGRLNAIKTQKFEDSEVWLRNQLFSEVSGEQIKWYLTNLTREPHVAGTEANLRVAQYIKDVWTDQGLSGVRLVPYEVLLSYPDYNQPNTFQVMDATGNVAFTSDGLSKVIIPSEQDAPGAGVRWNAYSVAGNVSSTIVYCNYGRPIDFDQLDQLGINISGSIALIRFGKVFRGNKVAEAQRRGAVGVILYSDPADCAPFGTRFTYPNSIYMPETGAQRGTLNAKSGDPLTPHITAKNWTYSSETTDNLKKWNRLPSIVVLPTSYRDAYEILKRLGGVEAPSDWQGTLNITYHLGTVTDQHSLRVQLSVKGKWEKRTINNVIAYIPGQTHPDEYVIVGNHYDAWVYGSIDPNSATAAMLEMSRVLQNVYERSQLIDDWKWTLGRTVLFCAWDAEEYGLIGSQEWVQEFMPILRQRAVVYLNVDNINGNQTLVVKATPSLYEVMVSAARTVPDPWNASLSLYDTWHTLFPSTTPWQPAFPSMAIPDSGSDMANMLQLAGIPTADFKMVNVSTNGTYPLYHTLYETVYLNEHLLDHDHFKTCIAVTRYWTELVRQFADFNVMPLNVTDYALAIELYAHRLNNVVQQRITKKHQSKIRPFLDDLASFSEQLRLESLDFYSNLLAGNQSLARVNSRLLRFEQCFVADLVAAGSTSNHVLFGVSQHDQYSAAELPELYDAIEEYTQAKDDQQRFTCVQKLLKGISRVLVGVNCATQLLGEFM